MYQMCIKKERFCGKTAVKNCILICSIFINILKGTGLIELLPTSN